MAKANSTEAPIAVEITDGHGTTLRLRVHEPIRSWLSEHVSEINSNRFRVEQIVCDLTGFSFSTEKPSLRFTPGRYWTEFVESECPSKFSVTGRDAEIVLQQYRSWEIDLQAERAARALNEGKITFNDLASQAPDLEHHPLIQKAATRAVFSGNVPSRRGPRKTGTKQSLQVQELIAWLTFYRAMESISAEQAAAMAVERHARLVPLHWKDPEGALLKAYLRHKHDRG